MILACPNIVSRADWNARSPTEINYRSVPVPFALIHHTAGAACSTQSACSQQARNVQDYEMDVKGYSDISYSFLVGEDGNVYEGRGWDRVGGHATGHNTDSIGICFFGTFTGKSAKTELSVYISIIL
jgi:peptidoglycan recognition protein